MQACDELDSDAQKLSQFGDPGRPGFQPMMLSPRYAQQISPNKNVICPCRSYPYTSGLALWSAAPRLKRLPQIGFLITAWQVLV